MYFQKATLDLYEALYFDNKYEYVHFTPVILLDKEFVISIQKSNRKAMNWTWGNQKPNPALKTRILKNPRPDSKSLNVFSFTKYFKRRSITISYAPCAFI